MTARCGGRCKGERSALDMPARIGIRAGRRILYCPCCGEPLRRVDEFMRDEEGNRVPARPPNLNPAIDARLKQRFSDDTCGYDVVLLAGLTPRT
jgi:hypothetical protein